MSEPTLQDCINYMRSQIKQMEKHPRNYEFNLPYYRKTVELLEKSDRPHGEWAALEYGYKCSVCTAAFYTHSNFCPNCGADMRVKDELNRVSKELNSEIEKSKSEIVPDYRDGWRLREGEEK